MYTLEKDDILKIPLFSGVEQDRLLSVLRGCEVKEFRPGQYIYRYGEYGEDCGIILSGSVRIELPIKGAEHTEKEIILQEGEIFGEMAVLSRYARTADIVVLQPTKILVIARDKLLELFDQIPLIKKEIDSLYRQRVLSNQLLSIPIFAGVPSKLLDEIKDKATLNSFHKGEAIFYQGDEADAFYLVRYGFVKVIETGNDSKERVIAYLRGGHYFGEMALLEEGEKRMATITAINSTELIRISRKDFLSIIKSFPHIKDRIEKTIEKRKDRNVQIHENNNLELTLSAVVGSEVIQAKGILVMDTTKCIQCDRCVKACAALHNNQSRLQRKGVKILNTLLLVTSCKHCDDPTCMINCRTGAISRDSTGEIYHKDFCVGCGECARKCPYGNISIVTLPETKRRENLCKKAAKCDMCRDYTFIGCEYKCPSGAVRMVDPTDFFTDIITIE
jgi:CRP-like cAMP-binding protein/Fe-S-cluster-containing hydrogenase component 2